MESRSSSRASGGGRGGGGDGGMGRKRLLEEPGRGQQQQARPHNKQLKPAPARASSQSSSSSSARIVMSTTPYDRSSRGDQQRRPPHQQRLKLPPPLPLFPSLPSSSATSPATTAVHVSPNGGAVGAVIKSVNRKTGDPAPTLYLASWAVPAAVALLPLAPAATPDSDAAANNHATICLEEMLRALTAAGGGHHPDVLAVQGLWPSSSSAAAASASGPQGQGQQGGSTKREQEEAGLRGALSGYKAFIEGIVGVFVSEYLLPSLLRPPSPPPSELAWAEAAGRVLLLELPTLAIVCLQAPPPRSPPTSANRVTGDLPAQARARFDDGVNRLCRRLKKAGKQVAVLGRFNLMVPADRRAFESPPPIAPPSTAADGKEHTTTQKPERLFPEERRFEEQLLGALDLEDTYRACYPRDAEGGWTLRKYNPTTGAWLGARPDLILLPRHTFAHPGPLVAAGVMSLERITEMAERVVVEGNGEGDKRKQQLLSSAPLFAAVNLDALLPPLPASH